MKLQEILHELEKGNFIRRLKDKDGYVGMDERGMYYCAGYPGHHYTITINTSFSPNDLKANDWEVVIPIPIDKCNHPACKLSTGRIKNPHPYTHKWPTDVNNRDAFLNEEFEKLTEEEKSQIPHEYYGPYLRKGKLTKYGWQNG